MGEVELLAPSLSATITTSNPTDYGTLNDEISISGLSANESYIINYGLDLVANSVTLTSNSLGELIIDNLDFDNYINISIEEVLSGCTGLLDEVVLIGPNLSATITASNPTSCHLADGSITISGLLNNENYQVDYFIDSVLESFIVSSDEFGIITLLNKSSGYYSNITLTQISNKCFVDLGFLLLECEIKNQSCFEAKPFFTPNGDDTNDTWFLIPSNENDICSYRLLIYNRYGKLIKELTNENSHWDGTYNGNKMPSNDYWYVVFYNENGNNLEYKSHFSLKR